MARELTVEIIGQRVVAIRPLTPAEAKAEGWTLSRRGPPFVLALENGTLVYASCDAEGNRPGALFGRTPRGDMFVVGG
jgi:hypothetical protein